MYLEIPLPSIDLVDSLQSNHAVAFRWLNWIGHILVKEVKITIGGQEIDKQSGEWLHIWNELTQKGFKTIKLENLCYKYSALMNNVIVNTTHGKEFESYFCSEKHSLDCIGNKTTLSTMLDIGKEFSEVYSKNDFAEFLHVENMHEDSRSHVYLVDNLLSKFIKEIYNSNIGFVLLSDHGLHYGTQAFAVKGYFDIFNPFAFTNIKYSESLSHDHFGMKCAIREFLGLSQPLESTKLPVNIKNNNELFDEKYGCNIPLSTLYSFRSYKNTNNIYDCKFDKFKKLYTENIIHADYKIIGTNSYVDLLQPPQIIVSSNTFSWRKLERVPKTSVYVIEIDSLSKYLFKLFFPKTLKVLSSFNFPTNSNFENFRIVGAKSIPNQIALLSKCHHTYGNFSENTVEAKVGFISDCSKSLFEVSETMNYKSFFGEEFCNGDWSVSNLLKLNDNVHIHNDIYCNLNEKNFGFYSCNGHNLTSLLVLDRLKQWIIKNGNFPQFSFTSLITLHNINKLQTEGDFGNRDISLINKFDEELSNWLLKFLKAMHKSRRKFILVLKGDHGLRYDNKDIETFESRVTHMQPFLHIVSDSPSFININKDKVISPYDIYDIIYNSMTESNSNDFLNSVMKTRTCKESGIPKRFCECPLIFY